MRPVDALQTFPFFILALTLAAVLGPGLGNAMMAIGMVPGFSRRPRWSNALAADRGASLRQLAVVDWSGLAAAHTGKTASPERVTMWVHGSQWLETC